MKSEDSIKLLEKVDAGCQMAVESIAQIFEFEVPDKLGQVLKKYDKKHKELQKKASKMLKEMGGDEVRPNPMSSAMSWITTEAKMMIKGDKTQIAKLMMDGCNMGIQTVGENISKYVQASKESKELADDLISLEEHFMAEVKEYL